MAERRMFAKTIIDSDAFLDLPIAAQALYFHLAMRADDDGFINKPRAIMGMIGAKNDDAKALIEKKFIIPFDSGVVVIKHWRIHNYIRKDTYSETKYKFEKATLYLDENNSYSQHEQPVDDPSTFRQRPVDDPSTQVRLGKDSIGKDSIGQSSLAREDDDSPKYAEILLYATMNGGTEDQGKQFFDFWTANNWIDANGNPVRDWKALLRYQLKNGMPKLAPEKPKSGGAHYTTADVNMAELQNIYDNI